jgi:hypothetical protein
MYTSSIENWDVQSRVKFPGSSSIICYLLYNKKTQNRGIHFKLQK